MRPSSFRHLASLAFLLAAIAAIAGCSGTDNTSFHSSVSADRTTGIPANGVDAATITVTVTRDGKPYQSRLVKLEVAGAGTVVTHPGLTNSNGSATGKVAATVVGTVTVRATVEDEGADRPVGNTLVLTFVADRNAVGKEVTLSDAGGLSVDAGDFTGDHRPDLVFSAVGKTGGGNIALVLEGRIGPGFDLLSPLVDAIGPADDVAVGDFNGDKNLDFVQAIARGVGDFQFYFGDGKGGFAAPVTVTSNFTGAGARYNFGQGDLNGDGLTDVVVTDNQSNRIFPILGGFTTLTALPLIATGPAPFGVRIGDMNGDGLGDIVVSTSSGFDPILVYLSSNPGPTFTLKSSVATTGAGAIALGDLDGDGDLDVAIAESSEFVRTYINDGTGGLSQGALIITGGFPVDLSIADLDGDGRNDVAVSVDYELTNSFVLTGPGTLNVYPQTSPGIFASPIIYQFETTVSEIAILRAALESPTRVAVVLPSEPSVGVVYPTGSKVVANPTTVTADGVAHTTITVTLRDLNGNPISGAAVTFTATGTGNTIVQPGTTDASGVAVGTLASTVAEVKQVTASADAGSGFRTLFASPRIRFGGGPATQLTFIAQPRTTTAGIAMSPHLTVGATDAFGNIDRSFNRPVTLSTGNNPGGGTLGGAVTVTALNGEADFNPIIDKTGAGYTLVASATGLSDGTSQPFDITPGTANHITISSVPSTTAGQAISVSVTAFDSHGNVAGGYAGTVTVSIANNPGGGTLSGTTSTAASAGVASFSNLSIDRSGTGYTLRASGTGGVSTTTSAAFDITPGAATELVFQQQPVDTAAGVSITPAVQVAAQDALGNTDTSFAGPIGIAISSNPSGGALSGTTPQSATAGVATFSDLAIDLAGSGYRLFASGVGAGVTSTPFSIGAGVATTISFTAQPSAATAGTAIAPAIVVTAFDGQGNVATGFGGTISLAIGTNPGGGTITAGASTSASSGVATFSSVAIDKAGSGYTLVASGVGGGATSATFGITTGTASALFFVQQPTNTTAGLAINPAVTVRVADGLGNTVVTTTAISLAIGTNPGGGTLLGGGATPAANGVTTFGTLSIDRAGSGYTLLASGGGLAGATSTAFNIGAGAAATISFTAQPSSAVAGTANSPPIVVTAFDSQGNVATGYGSSVSLAIAANPGGGTLTGGSVSATAGIATFSNVKIDRAAVGYTVQATAVGVAGSVTSTSFSITTGTASALLFVQQPTTATAGAAIAPAPSVRVTDGQGNTVSTSTAIALAIGSNPGGGTLSGSATVTASNGLATFPGLSIQNAGVGYTLAASASGLTGATSGGFGINADTATTLVFTTQPSTTPSTVTITPAVVVTARDQFGNTATGFVGQVDLAIGSDPSGGAAVLAGTKSRTASSGVAAFGDLSIDRVGTGYTLTATASAVTGGGSASFDIVAGPASRLAFTGQPGDVDQGAPLSVQVQVRDALGNVTTGASVSVTLSIAPATNTGGGTLTGQLTRTSAGGFVTFDGVGVDRPGLGYQLAATLGTPQGTTTSAAFDVFPQDVRVEDFTINSTRVALGAATTTAWAFAGDPSVTPDFVTLTAGLSATTTAATSQPGATPAGTLLVTPFPSSAAALAVPDPRAFVEVRGSTVTLTGRVAEFTSAQTCGGTGEDWAYAVAAARDGGTLLGGYVPGGTSHFGATTTSTASRSAYVARFPAGSPDAAWVFTARACTVRGVAALADGSAAAVGTVDASGSGLGTLDVGAVVLRLDGASGALLWAQGITGTAIQGVAATLDGGLFVAGAASSTGDFVFGAGLNATTLHLQGGEGFIARYDLGGNLLWASTQNGRGTGGNAAVAALPDGGAVVTSTTGGSVHVARHAADGTVLWVVTATAGALVDIGGVAGLPDGGCAFTGRASGATFGATSGVTGAYAARVSPLGQIVRVSTCGDANTRSYGITAFQDGGVAILGQFDGTIGFGPAGAPPLAISAGGLDAFVARFEPDGALGWTKPFGGPGTEEPHGIAALPGGSVVVAGLLDAAGATFGVEQRSPVQVASHGDFDIFVARVDPVNYRTLEVKPGGFALASSTVGLSEVRAGAAFPDGSFAIAGFFQPSLTLGVGEPGQVTLTAVSGSLDVFVARYNADGTLAWARGIGSASGNEVAQGMAALPDGSFVVTGDIQGSADFGGTTLPSAGIFVARYSRAGALVYAKLASNGSPNGFGVSAFPDGGVVVGGQYSNSATFGPGESAGTNRAGATVVNTASGGMNGFLARYNFDGTLRWVRTVSATANNSSLVRGVGAFGDGSCAAGGGFTGSTIFPGSRTLTSKGGLDWFVARYDRDGNIAWVRQAGGQGSDQSNTFTTLPDGGAVMSGSLVDTATTVIELDGTLATTSFLGGSTNFRDNISALKYDAAGTFVTVTAAPVNGGQGFSLGIAALPDSSFVLTGLFQGTATFGPGSVLTPSGFDGFVAGYGPDGALRFAKKFGGSSTDQGRAIAAFSDGSVVIGGSFNSPATFGAGEPAQKTLSPGGAQNGFFAKYFPYGN